MGFNKLLQKQISKFLTEANQADPSVKEFLSAINDSYIAFERDRELMEHAFQESEKEYNEIHSSLKEEYDLKKKSIANLYESLQVLGDDGFKVVENETEDLLYISKYLNHQVERRKAIEKDLSTTVELLKTLLANLQSGILVEDENRKILFTNQLFCEMFSIPISPEQMIGMDCTNSAEQSKGLFKDPDSFTSGIETTLKNKKIVTNELLETIHNQFLERDYIPIYIKEEYKGHLWKYNDVTQRIKTKKLLEQSEERNRLIMNSALNAIITIDQNSMITFWNNQSEIIFGWKGYEVLGKDLADIIIPERFRASHHKGMKHFNATGEAEVLNKQIELTALHKEGHEFPVEISIIPIKQNNEIIFCSFIQDISERKKAENNLKFQEEKYRNIIANMNLGLIEVDNNEIIQYANHSFETISGFESNELIGRNPASLFLSGENIEVVKSKIESRKKGISDIYQLPVKNKRGELRWWAISGAPNYDDKGTLVGSIGIHLDITSQKELEIELEKEKIRAEEASKAKEIFLANMSHEIRTPLNAIIGFLRELKKQKLTEKQEVYIENSTIASKHLLAIINNILDMSKIEAGEMAIEEENFILENSIKNVVTVLSPKAIQKKIRLHSYFDKKIDRVLKGDVLRIEQILFNLVGNSIKFTPKGEIKISCDFISEERNRQKIKIAVSDTGIGMDKKFTETIFKKFSQEDKNVTRKFGGTGLGMAITKELVDLMGGEIEVLSKKGKGTTINLFFQLAKGDGNVEETQDDGTRYFAIEGSKILLVEDNEFNKMVARSSLEYFNCEITEADNGLTAIEILRKRDFDIILMDLQMPVMDGIEATTIIRNELQLTTPIIALTANAFKSEIEKCFQAGVNDYVTKPFEEEILLEVISKYIKHNKEEQEEQSTEEKTLYDLASLHKLSAGNADFVTKMIHIFIQQATETIDKIDQAIAIEDFEEVNRLTHRVKPSIQGVGIYSITEKVKSLEKMAKEHPQKEEIITLFNEVRTVLEETIVQLKEKELKT